jgi:hypothetical protein
MPITSLNSPLNVNPQGGTSGDMMGNLNDMIGQVQGQSQQFGQMMTDPNFTGGSEMGTFLKLQREVMKEQMMYQTTSNIMKARADASKNAISNMR